MDGSINKFTHEKFIQQKRSKSRGRIAKERNNAHLFNSDEDGKEKDPLVDGDRESIESIKLDSKRIASDFKRIH